MDGPTTEKARYCVVEAGAKGSCHGSQSNVEIARPTYALFLTDLDKSIDQSLADWLNVANSSQTSCIKNDLTYKAKIIKATIEDLSLYTEQLTVILRVGNITQQNIEG